MKFVVALFLGLAFSTSAQAAEKVLEKGESMVICETGLSLERASLGLNTRLSQEVVFATRVDAELVRIEKPFSVSAPEIDRNSKQSVGVCVVLTKR